MERFLAIHALPAGTPEPDFRRMLETLARVADELGVDVTQTVYSLEGGQAFSVIDAENAVVARDVVSQAGFPTSVIVPASVIYTDLLSEPRRDR